MSAPKHLWSGDWRADAAAAAQKRAGQRIETPPPEEPPPAPQQPSLLTRALAALRAAGQALAAALAELAATLRRTRIPTGAVVVVALLAIAGAAYGLSALFGSNSPPASSASRNIPYLGVQMESVPVNRVLVAGVVPGSPADRAGLGPGDVITAVNHRPVGQPGDVISALSSMHPGNSVLVQFSRGGVPYATQVKLTSQPSPSP
jgi:predicted metalloprotease with PDZ domain